MTSTWTSTSTSQPDAWLGSCTHFLPDCEKYFLVIFWILLFFCAAQNLSAPPTFCPRRQFDCECMRVFAKYACVSRSLEVFAWELSGGALTARCTRVAATARNILLNQNWHYAKRQPTERKLQHGSHSHTLIHTHTRLSTKLIVGLVWGQALSVPCHRGQKVHVARFHCHVCCSCCCCSCCCCWCCCCCCFVAPSNFCVSVRFQPCADNERHRNNKRSSY